MDGLTLFGLFAVAAMLVCYALERRSHWFILAFAELRTLLSFGINLVGGGMVDFFTRNADIYLINMSAGVRDLGFYAIAMQIVRLPDTVLIGPIFTALFPVIAAASDDVSSVSPRISRKCGLARAESRKPSLPVEKLS